MSHAVAHGLLFPNHCLEPSFILLHSSYLGTGKATTCYSGHRNFPSAGPPPVFLYKVAFVGFATCATKCGKFLSLHWTVLVWSLWMEHWLHCAVKFTNMDIRWYGNKYFYVTCVKYKDYTPC